MQIKVNIAHTDGSISINVYDIVLVSFSIFCFLLVTLNTFQRFTLS